MKIPTNLLSWFMALFPFFCGVAMAGESPEIDFDNNDTRAVPPNPGNYTLKMLPDGKVSMRADCNMGGGAYKLDESKISIEITHTTKSACPPESLERDYIRDLNAAAIYFFKGDVLYIDLKQGTGTMKFMH